MNIGIIGYGIVGKAVDLTISRVHSVFKYDKYQPLNNFEELKDCEIIFITVPTPFDCDKNEVDDSAITETLSKLDDLSFNNTVLIKSTVPPGFCNSYRKKYNLNIVFNPEFLRESTTPNEDFANQQIVVIGTSSKSDFDSVKAMYCSVLHDGVEYYHTSLSEAEMIKCSQNTMLASRVALANMIYDACEANNLNYSTVCKIAFDKFNILGPHMVQVPGPDGERGFGGKCLPKDIRAFSTIHESELLETIISYNDTLRDDLSHFLQNYKKV